MATKSEQTAPLNPYRRSDTQVSWRQQLVTISGHALKTISFMDTAPNMFMIQNPTHAVLYVGISNIPTTENYEWKVNKNTSKTFGRPISTKELFIYNTSDDDITINLFSVRDEFDLSLLSDTTVSLEEAVIDAIRGDGYIYGFGSGVSLPSGTHHIGNVSISDALPSGTNHIGEVNLSGALPSGTNVLGKVGLDDDTYNTLNVIRTACNSLIKSSSVTNSINLYDINETLQTLAANMNTGMYLARTKVASVLSKEQSGTHQMSFTSDGQSIKIYYFTNDSADDISIVWKEVGSTIDQTITVKAGETITDMEFAKLVYLHIICTADTDAWRLCYANLRG